MQREFHAVAKVEAGKLIHDDPVSLGYWLSNQNGKTLAILYEIYSERRTEQQNKSWWKIMIPAFSKCYGYRPYEKEEAHRTLCLLVHYEIREDKNGKPHRHARETKKLTTVEWSELWESAAQYMAEEYGYAVPDPDPRLRKKK